MFETVTSDAAAAMPRYADQECRYCGFHHSILAAEFHQSVCTRARAARGREQAEIDAHYASEQGAAE